MPLRPARTSLVLLALLFAAAHSFSQRQGKPGHPMDGGMQQRIISIFIPSLPNAPFSATVNTTSSRLLSDGTTITVVNHRRVVRDRAGRIFQERRMLVPDDGKHKSLVTQIEISDPVAHNLYICSPPGKTCQLEFFTAQEFSPPPTGPSPNREDLGKRLIDGVNTVGTLVTRVIPSQLIGNDQPITMKIETWYSPQLGVNLLTKREDPRSGSQTFELSDVSMGEPGASYFKVPGGYRVIDLRDREAK
jgi:hypothetical protein